MMLVHSFSVTEALLDDFIRFAAAMGTPVAVKDAGSEPQACRRAVDAADQA